MTIALNYDEMKKNHQRLNKINKLINRYDWSRINFPSQVGDWKKFELNNKSVALNVLYVPYGDKTIRHAYKSKKYNLKRENQVILLMIRDNEKWHYLRVKSLSALLKGVTSHHGDSYCLNCFHSHRTEKALAKAHESM